MSNRKILLVVLFLAMAWPLATASVSWADAAPEEAWQAARDGLHRFLGAIPLGELGYFGFRDEAEVSRAGLGAPFLVHTVLPEEILTLAEGAPIEVEIRPTNVWKFPVVCDGTPRTLLTVSYVAGLWEAFDLGGLSPAVEMEEIGRVWPSAEGYELRYVRIYQTGSQFISVTRDGKTHLVPVEWTARSLGMLEEGEVFQYKLMGIPDVAATLAPYVRASLERMQE